MDNTPHGEGKETGPNHEFTGSYIDGKKTRGTMKWTEGKDEFIYTGEFDEDGLFHGEGICALIQVNLFNLRENTLGSSIRGGRVGRDSSRLRMG